MNRLIEHVRTPILSLPSQYAQATPGERGRHQFSRSCAAPINSKIGMSLVNFLTRIINTFPGMDTGAADPDVWPTAAMTLPTRRYVWWGAVLSRGAIRICVRRCCCSATH